MKRWLTFSRQIYPYVALVSAILVFGVIFVHFWNYQFEPLRMLKLVSYFTIQTNLVTALWMIGFIIYLNNQKPFAWVARRRLLNALFTYNFVTMIVYLILLSGLDYSQYTEFNPFWDLFFMHYITPVIYFIGYFIYVDEDVWKPWDWLLNLVYPLIYFGYSFIYEQLYGQSIYPFLSRELIGIGGYVLSVVGILILMVILSVTLSRYHYSLVKKR